MSFLYPYRHYLLAIVLLLIITAISQLFRVSLGLINIALIHLIPVIVIALRGNISSTMAVTFLSVLLFDLLYVPPEYSFDVHDLTYIWSFIIFFAVGYIISDQAKRIQGNAIQEIFINTLSHDLKTPLSSILGNTSLLMKKELSDPEIRHNVLLQIHDSTQRMNRLISNLLDSARLQENQNLLRLEWCDFEDIVGVALQEFRDNPRQKFIEIYVDHEIPLFWGDCALLVRLIVNLIDNALKYSDEGKKISLRISGDTQTLTILCCNESEPIKKSDLHNMFNRFYRIDYSGDIHGSGIGLSICQDIVHAHKGTIKAYNEDNGVCFEIRFILKDRLKPIQ